MTTQARVTVTIEIPVSDSWGDDCTMSQIKKQATDSALGSIRKAFNGHQWNIIGEPEVRAIIVCEKQ